MANKRRQARELKGDASSEDPDDSDVERSKREDERGRTVLVVIGKALQSGTKIPLKWHSVYKTPYGKYKSTFSTYMGVVTRERVCITYKVWKELPKDLLDELYEAITRGFKVLENRRKWTLQQAAERWRAFKTRLRKRWLYHKKSGRVRSRPPWKYPFITQEAWNKFKELYTTDEFKTISEQSRKRSKLNNSSYRGGPLGYIYFEEEIANEITKQGVHVDHVPRHLTCIRAHSREENGRLVFKNPLDEEVAYSIYALDAQAKRGDIQIMSLRDDILSRALNKPEHGGRVKAVGSGVTNREYFGLNTPTSPSQLQSEMRCLKSELQLMKTNWGVMMSFMMSVLSQEQMKQFIACCGGGTSNGQFGMHNGHSSGQFSGAGGHNKIVFGNDIDQCNMQSGRYENSGALSTGSDGRRYEGGFFTQLLSGAFDGYQQQPGGRTEGWTEGPIASNFQTEPEPYVVPWPDQSTGHRSQPSPSQRPPSEQPSPLQQPSSIQQPIVSQQHDKHIPHTSESGEDYDTQPISELEIPEGDHECRLAIEIKTGIQFVAIGEVHIPGATQLVLNHFNTVQEGYRRVSISEDLVPNALLPCPTKEFRIVCQAKDTFVQWPTHLIFPKKKSLKAGLSNKSSRSPSSQGSSFKQYIFTEKDLAKVTSGLLEALKNEAFGMKKSGKTIKLTIPYSVFQNENDVILDYEDMLNWCFQREVGFDQMSIFMRELSEKCTKQCISGVFGFIDPNYISRLTPTKEEERSDYLSQAFACNGAMNRHQLFFAPYHEVEHWMLAAISPWNGTVFWLDPAGEENDVRPFAKWIINEGIKKFSLIHHTDVKKIKKGDAGIKWFKRQCPRQAQDIEDCGYYVCRYMHETIDNRRPLIPEKYFNDTPTYSQKEIDEVRDTWVTYVLKNKEVDK